ncbi:hypothetical protein YH64_029370 [Achromobacter sp. LC458]|uniref:hypothetical protein n=1 Tax=Achromobacter sp. LC458 TaxID=1120623 RepID=UPI00062A3D68|nr:hypothetical protein [Achromobacter sp. LC458]TRM49410.1 hypothetical protein YH64_029370 [Achromobacter sp. LC458]
MINRDEFLISEIRQLERMLEDIPASAAIQRISIENRLNRVRAALKRELASPVPPRVKLTFRGRPTIGSHGIAADFGGKATIAFADAFAAVVAGLNDNLQLMGPIPNREKNQLLITGTAVGSFGFEFELPAGGLFPEQENTEEALRKMQSLLEASATGSDDDVAELVDAIHPRAVKKISEFLSVLSQYQAWCGLEFKDRIFRYDGFDQLTRSASRLGEENIQEAAESYAGEFVGILPNSRTFEFQTADGLIKGRIGASIEDPGVILRDWLKRSVHITLAVVHVGQGRPRFTLNDLPDHR